MVEVYNLDIQKFFLVGLILSSMFIFSETLENSFNVALVVFFCLCKDNYVVKWANQDQWSLRAVFRIRVKYLGAICI